MLFKEKIEMVLKANIIGTGSYLPERVLTNQELEKMVETNDEWIVSRTGMKERRLAKDGEFTSDMGAAAAKAALADAGLSADEIDFVLVATITPDYLCPSSACLIQKAIGAKRAASMDVQAACTGFIYALSIAKSFVETGLFKNVLVVASEKLSSVTDYRDRSTCILFGDGAGACVVSASGKQGLSISSVCLGSDGEQSDLIVVPTGGCRSPATEGKYLQMAGNEVFKHAVRRMESACRESLERAELQESDISWLIPHQANIRIIDAMAKRFEHLPPEKVFKTVHKYGNTSASSVAIALDELRKQEKILEGEHILLTAFGGGLTWGAAILTAAGATA